MTMLWQQTYPTLATLNEANLQTLCAWVDNLPPPQTDVERTIHRRLLLRQNELMRKEVREVAPDIADKLDDLYRRMENLGITPPHKR